MHQTFLELFKIFWCKNSLCADKELLHQIFIHFIQIVCWKSIFIFKIWSNWWVKYDETLKKINKLKQLEHENNYVESSSDYDSSCISNSGDQSEIEPEYEAMIYESINILDNSTAFLSDIDTNIWNKWNKQKWHNSKWLHTKWDYKRDTELC